MDGASSYLNTHLDLTSVDDLTALGAAFEAAGVRPLRICEVKHGGPWIHCKFRRKNGKWESDWMLFNHGGIVKVKPRLTS